MKKNDILIIGIILLLAGAIFVWNNFRMNQLNQGALSAEIYLEGELYQKVSLLEEKEIIIETELGRNVIQVTQGAVKMVEADCADQICVRMGEIQQAGNNIVCLPNKVHFQIVGDTKDGVDAIAE